MFFSLIKQRRSIRKFKPVPVETEKRDLLIEAALRAPSSRGFNPWRFIVIDDSELLTCISDGKPHGASFLKGAALGIVVCGDSKKSDVWVEDTSIASTYIQLAAQELGLGSCWIQIRKRGHDDSRSAEDYIKEILNVPEHVKIESIIALGYPDEDKAPHTRDSLDQDKVFYNRYGSKKINLLLCQCFILRLSRNRRNVETRHALSLHSNENKHTLIFRFDEALPFLKLQPKAWVIIIG